MPDPHPTPAAADRNLLFGILAVQMDFLHRDALIAAMHAWVLEKTKPLGRILLDQGTLAAADHELLEELVQRHLEKHGHDAERSLAVLTAPEAVRADLGRIADGDLHASLAQLPATPTSFHESLATTAPLTPDGARFRILRPHASGGLGDVFVARDGELNREVALKEIQARHVDHPESRARFLREAEITGGLEHPGVVPVYALGQYADGRPYYAMRFIRGDSLKAAIERFHAGSLPEAERNLELRQLLTRFIAVCNAIAYAHSRGVLHRDLKPANIMLGEFGETLVVDWGLAKVVAGGGHEQSVAPATNPLPASEDSELTHTGQALGTPAYMSPEQAAGRLDQLGPASDVYSLGATLYHLLTGQSPFAKSDMGVVLAKVQKGDFPPPRRVQRHVPQALEAICLKAMALPASERYVSAKALADDLEHWLADEAVTAHAEPWYARLGRWVRHHRGLVGTAAGLLLLALTTAFASWRVYEAAAEQAKEQELRGVAEDERDRADQQRAEADRQRGEAETQRNLARRYLYCSRTNLADRAWQEAQLTRMEELLQQTRPENTGGEELRGFEWYYLDRLRQACLLSLKGHTNAVLRVAYSPDSRRLASAGQDGTVRVWGAPCGQELLIFRGHTGPVTGVAFSPDGERIASTGPEGAVKVWDARTGQEALALKGHIKDVLRVAFSPDGRHLASAGQDETVRVWDLRTGEDALTLKGHAGPVLGVTFSPDSQQLASAGQDGTIRLWNARTGQGISLLKGHTGAVQSVAYSPDGQRLASTGLDRTVKLWDARAGRETLTLKGHTLIVLSVAFSPDGQCLASGGMDRVVKVWDVHTGEELFSLKGHTDFVMDLAFSPDGQRLATAGADGMVKVWSTRTRPESLSLRGHVQAVVSVAFSPDGQRLATASRDTTLKIWNARTGQESLTLTGHGNWVTSVAFSPDGRRLASASRDQSVKIWDAHTGHECFTLSGHQRVVESVAFSPDSQRLAAGGDDGTVKLWDAGTGRELLTLQSDAGSIHAVAFRPDGWRLAAACRGGTVKLWDTGTGQPLFSLSADANNVLSVAFTPNGQRLVSTGGEGTVKVWDARTGQELLSLARSARPVEGVACSPDSQRLAFTGADGTVKIWDAQTGQEILSLPGHLNNVISVAFSPDGRRLASGGWDHTVTVWDATPWTERSAEEWQALAAFHFGAETIVLKEEMLQHLRKDPTLSEPVREQALALAGEYREIAVQLNDASWRVVRGSWARPGAFALALRQAEAASRQEPENGLLLNTLGAAQYRNGQYAAALKTLARSDQVHAARFNHSLPADLAFLAMTQLQLGQKTEAAATLDRLRDVMKKWPPDWEAEELLREAESVVSAEK